MSIQYVVIATARLMGIACFSNCGSEWLRTLILRRNERLRPLVRGLTPSPCHASHVTCSPDCKDSKSGLSF